MLHVLSCLVMSFPFTVTPRRTHTFLDLVNALLSCCIFSCPLTLHSGALADNRAAGADTSRHPLRQRAVGDRGVHPDEVVPLRGHVSERCKLQKHLKPLSHVIEWTEGDVFGFMTLNCDFQPLASLIGTDAY